MWMKVHWVCQVLRVVSGLLLVAGVMSGGSEGAILVVGLIWLVLCMAGVLLMISVLLVIGVGAGAAQADWMSDGFVVVVFFVMPTVVSVAFFELLRWWFVRRERRKVEAVVQG